MSTSNAPVKWAQRKDKLFITVEVKDATKVNVDFQEKTITVTGTGINKVSQTDASDFKTVLNLAGEIDPTKSTFHTTGFSIQVCAIKKEVSDEHWPKLTVEAAKTLKNWLSVDWALWKDEDEEKEGEKVDFGGYGGDMGGMGGMGGMPPGMMGGMPGMGGAGGAGGMGGMDMQQLMAQMGGMGGMGGMAGGMPGMEGMGGEEGADSDDEAEPPTLEDVDGKEQK